MPFKAIVIAFCVAIFAYLVGSINFAVIFSKIFIKKDVREMGSGNAGATNVLRVGGVVPGLLTFVFDAIKGFVAAGAGRLVFQYITDNFDAFLLNAMHGAFICGLLCMLGHIFPVFFQFKGGKGVATSVGIFAVCCPLAITLGLLAFVACLILTRIVSFSSLLATCVVVITTIILNINAELFLVQTGLTVLMGSIVFLKHIDNIKRLLSGTEKKITFRR